LIFREVDRVVPRHYWSGLTFLDAFLGGGSVSLGAKAQGFNVVATDIAERSIVVGKALIENSRVRLVREDVLRLLAPRTDELGRIERELSPSVFTKNVARFLDAAFETAEQTGDVAKAALLRLLAIRVALLAHPMSQVRAGTAHRATTGEWEAITQSCIYHYVDGLRLDRLEKLWALAQQINAGVFEGRGRVIKASILDVLPSIQAVMSYEKEYRVIDQLLEGTTRSTSPFTAKTGASLLDTLFERATHIPVWVLSLGNAVVTIEELEAKMAKHGRKTKCIAIAYQHLPAVSTEEKKRENREFLVIGWDPEAALVRDASGRGLGLAEGDALGVVAGHVDADTRGPERSAAGSFARDRLQESQAAVADQLAPVGRQAVTPVQAGVDHPDPVLAESGFHRDGERGVDGLRHGGTIPLRRMRSQEVTRDE
jgi:hypothetical protein